MVRVKASKGILPGTLSGQPKALRTRKLEGYHRHGCTQCGQRYDDACARSDVNVRCRICRGSPHTLTPWERAYAPQKCCRSMARLATDDEVERYKLGGPGPWWICSPGHGCARTHPYDPRFSQPRSTP
jgi:hypothetical protein